MSITDDIILRIIAAGFSFGLGYLCMYLRYRRYKRHVHKIALKVQLDIDKAQEMIVSVRKLINNETDTSEMG